MTTDWRSRTCPGLEDRRRIRELRQRGASAAEIADALGLFQSSVRNLLRILDSKAFLTDRSAKLLREIQSADDPDRRWKIDDLLDALALQTRPHNALAHYFERHDGTEASLREVMDLAIPEALHRQPGFLVTSLLMMRNLGIDGFWNVIARLTESDLGERSNRLWRGRLARLSRSRRIVGSRAYSWSKPCEPPPNLVPVLERLRQCHDSENSDSPSFP